MSSRNTYHLTCVSLALDMGYLFMAAPAKCSHCSLPWTSHLPDLEHGVAPLSPPAPLEPPFLGCRVIPLGCHPWPWTWGSSSKANWLFVETLQIAVKRREMKSKGEKERYSHLNAEFQRIARRDKTFLSDQCKQMEENNWMGKTRDHFKKIRDTKGTFHTKMG